MEQTAFKANIKKIKPITEFPNHDFKITVKK